MTINPNPEVQAAAAEATALAGLPTIPLKDLQPGGHGGSGRCDFCGRFKDELVMAQPAVADAQGNVIRPARYKGVTCCGQRHL
jgi:hypothetical protein